MRLLLSATLLLLTGLALVEVLMRPSAAARLEVGVIFSLMVITSAGMAVALPRLARSFKSLRVTLMLLAVVSFGLVTAGIVVAALRMFLSQHDAGLTLVVVGFGVVAALVFAIAVNSSLTADLRKIAATTSRIAAGDLSPRSGLIRNDEVGQLALAIDEMAATLESAEKNRLHDEKARRSFFAAVGHDLRTPLASLNAAVEALQDGVASDPSRFLEAMKGDITALSRLADDLFLLAQIESGALDFESGPVDLTELADEAVEVLGPIATRKRVSLRLEAGPRVFASARPDSVARVLRNLLDNAIRHSPLGGEVVVTVANGALTTVTVRDDGPGFECDFVDRAFDRFTRDDPARSRENGGAGLGLAIADGFVSAMGGEIWAAPGPGGVVAFQLPGVLEDDASNRTLLPNR